LTNQKLYSTIFKPKALFYYFQKNSQVVADPFIALAFIFSPFGIKHQNGINLGPLTPLPHQNLQLRVKSNRIIKMNLE
jgi:tetrahydromethanopterin S-methyltransferase subunit C